MSYYVVNYLYDASKTGLMDQVRPQHRDYLGGLAEQGIVVASGPLTDTQIPSAVLVFKADSIEQVLSYLNLDPFWKAEVIADRSVNTWNPVIGILAD